MQPISRKVITIYYWKVGRVIDRAGLEIRYTPFGYRGFESLTFRQRSSTSHIVGLFFCKVIVILLSLWYRGTFNDFKEVILAVPISFCTFVRMKRLSYIVCTLCGLLLFSCGQRYEPALIAIDSIADAEADSAAVLLSGVDTVEFSEADRMYYHLLCAKVDDKRDVLDMTDEQAEQLVTYFEDDGDERLLPTAYYYGGRICVENSNAPQALDYFRKAEILLTDDHIRPMPEEDRDKALLSKVYSQMGYLFVYRKMYDEARQCSEQSYELDKAIRDTIGMIFNLRDIGTSYTWADQDWEALPYYNQARLLAIKAHDDIMRHDLEMSLASAYTKTNNLDSAKYYARRIIEEITPIDSSAVYSIASKMYYAVHQTDSAELLLNRLLQLGTKQAQCYAHKTLTKICIQNNQPIEALAHYEKSQTLKDSLDKEYSTSAIAQANSAYNYQSKERENYQLRLDNEHAKLILLSFIGIVIIIALTSVFFFNRYRHRQAEKLKELERIRNEQYQQSERYIEENRQRIAELEKQLQQSSALSYEQRKEIENEKAKLSSSNEIAILRNNENKRVLDNIRSSSVFLRMMDMAEQNMPQKISDDDWHELEIVINREHNNFKQRIDSLCRPNPVEYRVCLLLKAQVEPVKIALIIMRAKNSVSSIRSRLYQKAFGRKGSAKDWDEVIYSL